jgi:hypothetical protein
VIVGLDGGYVRIRHRRPERNFEVIAGKVIHASGAQHRFAFPRNGGAADDFARALARAGVRSGRLPRCCRMVTPVCGTFSAPCCLPRLWCWIFHIAMRFEHVLSATAGLGAGTIDAHLGAVARRDIERANWCLWHGRWKHCLVKLVTAFRWSEAKRIRDAVGIETLRRHLKHLIDYLEANTAMLVNYGARRRHREPISTAFVESAVNEIVSRRMIKKEQMRWNRWTVQSFLDVRVAVLSGTLEGAFRRDPLSRDNPSIKTLKPPPPRESPLFCMLPTLKKQLLWVRYFATVEDLRLALAEFAALYNASWLRERQGYRTPDQIRADQQRLASSTAMEFKLAA